MDRIIGTTARGRPLRQLPRLPRATLRRGVQVLADSRLGMAPFRTDQFDVLGALSTLLPSDRLEVFWFADCPGRGVGPGSREGWGDWTPPPQQSPILILSDLGIGGPIVDYDRADDDEWLAFATRAREAGCPTIALVPYEPARWPRRLCGAMTLVHWSERLTASAVRHAVGRGHRVGP
jgi:hypothetical protein